MRAMSLLTTPACCARAAGVAAAAAAFFPAEVAGPSFGAPSGRITSTSPACSRPYTTLRMSRSLMLLALAIALIAFLGLMYGRGDARPRVRSLLHHEAGGHRARHVRGALGGGPPRRHADGPEPPGCGHARAGQIAGAVMRATVLVVDDERTVADGLRMTLESEGYGVRTAASVREALAAFAQCDPHAAILDLMLPDGDGLALTRELRRRDPGLQVIVITAYGSVRKAMEATKGAGAFYVLEKPFEPDELLGLVQNALDHRKLLTENADLKRRLVEQVADSEILGQAPGIRRVMETIAAVADADANVLIVGESGTGKELVADALHAQSRRRGGQWIKINCAALPKDLIESELFGHTKGAFTGATTDKVGLLEEADGGSLLLDEITEMPVQLQAKLLRVLEERAVRRLGGTKPIPVDFRLISSTNLNPEVALREGRLRQDLFFRINTVSLEVPQLRDRREDIPILVRAFVERYGAKHARPVEGIEPEAYRRLLAYAWPGNVRELQHAVERAILVTRGPMLTLADLPEPLQRAPGDQVTAAAGGSSEAPAGSPAEIERASIVRALETTRWNKQAAAVLLGLRRPTLYSKMRKHGIPQRRDAARG